MLRSFRARLLAGALAVAMLGIGVTAWVTNRTTSDDVERQVEEDVFVEQSIYEELTIYAITRSDWSGVTTLVEELATDFATRIVVAGLDGRVIADSEPDRPLPPTPVAIIDPANPLIEFVPESTGALDDLKRINAAGEGFAVYLNELGIDFKLVTDEFGITFPVWDEDDPRAEKAFEEYFLGSGFFEFSFFDDLGSEEIQRIEDEVFFDKTDFAEPALLYVETFEESTVAAVFSRRLLVAVLIVAGAAVLITVFLARRLMRPINALTDAAQGLQSGDLTRRVVVGENGEIGTLAEAFNSMAASLEESDGLRRTMTADIAHELRTPLANIRGYLEAAREGVLPPDSGLIDTVHEEAMLLQHLVEDLETLTQADAGRLRLDIVRLPLADVLTQVADAHRARAEAAGVALRVDAAEAPDIDGDPVRIRQAVGALVDNALRHTARGGAVTLTATRDGEEAVATVTDTGEGIAAEHLPHVFDRFYRADPSRTRATGGSGLGLAIARQIVEAHGGTVEAESTIGEGTTVTVTLPNGLS